MTQTFTETILRVPSGQHVRLRFLGRGPAVVLLHESPRSLEALMPLATRIGHRFACVMMDSPGYGLSDPMRLARPEIPDFGAVVVEVIRALGLGPVPVYGTHTGAAIAVEAGLQDPAHVSAVVLDGYAAFTAAERDALLGAYLPPFVTSPDGTHVAWLWARVRDQFTAFPWNQVGDGCRLRFGPPPLSFMNAVVEDVLMAGDTYRIGYAAAFRYDHIAPLSRMAVPVRLGTRLDDLLHPHMARCAGQGPMVTVQDFPADRDLWGPAVGDILGQHTGGEALDPATLLAHAAAHQGARRMVTTAGGPVAARIDGAGPTVVLLHDLPGGMSDLDHLAQRLASTQRVVRLDLPGVAGSRHAAAGSVEAVAGAVAEALAALGAGDAPVVACGASLPVALAATTGPLVALDPWTQAAEGVADALPDLTPRWDGAHLNAAFWWARDVEIFKPWHRRVNAEGRRIGNERDFARIDARFRAAFLGGPAGVAMARALMTADCGALGARPGAQALLIEGDPDRAALTAWAEGLLGMDRVATAPRDPGALAAALRRMLR